MFYIKVVAKLSGKQPRLVSFCKKTLFFPGNSWKKTQQKNWPSLFAIQQSYSAIFPTFSLQHWIYLTNTTYLFLQHWKYLTNTLKACGTAMFWDLILVRTVCFRERLRKKYSCVPNNRAGTLIYKSFQHSCFYFGRIIQNNNRE